MQYTARYTQVAPLHWGNQLLPPCSETLRIACIGQEVSTELEIRCEKANANPLLYTRERVLSNFIVSVHQGLS